LSYLDRHRDEIFKKYSEDELIADVENFRHGSGNLTKVLNHFFEEAMFESCGKKTTISPMQALDNDKLMEKVITYINGKPKFFTGTEIQNVKSFMRNSASWVRKVANFPVKEARNIYNRYNENGVSLNCLDTSMGFGSRFSACIFSGHNYYGIDPSTNLHTCFMKYADFITRNGLIEGKFNLFCDGSEIFIPELEGLIDVSFTSPPYFNLEKYSDDGGESTKNYNDYQLWVDKFVVPTAQNTYKYLKSGGYAMINIKNINKKESCFDDFFKAFLDAGFKFVEIFDMKVQSKKQYGMKHNNEKGTIVPTEPVMSFMKV
jgi:hypothetical protein